MSRLEAEARLRRRAIADAGFRAWLLADPRAAIAADADIALEGSASVSVIEESPGEIVIAIPSPRGVTDDQLQAMVGGGLVLRHGQMEVGTGPAVARDNPDAGA